MTAAAADFLAVLLVSTFLVATLFTARLRRDLFVPGTFFCYSVSPHHVCGASIPISRRLPKEVEISFLWAQTQTTPPPSKAFASSVMFAEGEAVSFDVVVADKSRSVFSAAGEEIFLPR